jgi:hypothetical protein
MVSLHLGALVVILSPSWTLLRQQPSSMSF